MKNFKELRIDILSEDHNRAVQTRLFEMGYVWGGSADTNTDVRYLSAKTLFCWKDGFIAYSNNENYNSGTNFKLTTIDDLYRIDTVELKEGCWYSGNHCVFQFNGDRDTMQYGWKRKGDWVTDIQIPTVCRDVSDDFILSMVHSELNDRGIEEGDSIVSKLGARAEYRRDNLKLSGAGVYVRSGTRNVLVMRGGEFCKLAEAKVKLPELGGFEGVIDGPEVKYGCRIMSVNFIKDDNFLNINSMTFYSEGLYYNIKNDELHELREAVIKITES